MFISLTPEQIKHKLEFIKKFISAKNVADGSSVDSNANVSCKNIATLNAEIHKAENIDINRAYNYQEMVKIFGVEQAEKYFYHLKHHYIYTHDESSIVGMPYCVSISLYPFLLNGLKTMNGESKSPKHLYSFCGGFVNLMFALSSQFAGAVSTPELLLFIDYMARKDFGDNYLETHEYEIKQSFQHIIYCINQPAAARGFQSVFFNVSIFDRFFMKEMFKDFVFPDEKQTKVNYRLLDQLQRYFLKWINKERENAILTFPVITVAMLNHNNKPKDTSFANFISNELAEGNSFFIYQSNNVDSTSSCCRLRNEIIDKRFSYSLGSLGVMTGSIHVITINMNRFIQRCWTDYYIIGDKYQPDKKFNEEFFNNFFKPRLKILVQDLHKYHHVYREIIKSFKAVKSFLPTYDSNFIKLEKQYSTIGINGFAEAAEFLEIKISNNSEYIKFASETLEVIYNENKKGNKLYDCMFNTEFVPAENLGVKNAKWDQEDDYDVKRNCYNSYFFLVEDENINILDKFILHGEKVTKFLDGGSACHINLEEHLTKEQYLKLMEVAAKTGCNYWTINVKATFCENEQCGFINKYTTKICSKCGGTNVSYLTRIIGYLKKISNFSTPRQIEESKRFYHKEQNKQPLP